MKITVGLVLAFAMLIWLVVMVLDGFVDKKRRKKRGKKRERQRMGLPKDIVE